MEVPRHHVAGLAVVSADIPTALDSLWSDAEASAPRVYALVNAHSATLRRHYSDYAVLLEDERVVPLPDGAALTFAGRLFRSAELGRCPGPDLLASAAMRASQEGISFYLLGGGPGVAAKLRDSLLKRHPDLRIAGISTPPFGVWDERLSEVMCRDIRESNADIVWLGVSAPKQEIWSLRNIDRIGRPVVCVGAAFDFLSGDKDRAPSWIRRCGMEWFYRLCSEPRRLWKRYLLGNLVFMADLIRYRCRPTAVAPEDGA